MANTSIEWTNKVWNFVTGCSKVSTGCKRCYAERMAKRLQAMGQPRYKNGFQVTIHPDLIEVPRSWKKPQRVFVNSMSDLFHPEVPAEIIVQAFEVMLDTPRHSYQILTKRPEIALSLYQEHNLPNPPNIWLGVSVENEAVLARVDILRQINVPTRFLSLEPLLEPLPNLNLEGIQWVIAGGESGPGSRPLELDTAISIREQCRRSGIPFFFKQWGGVNKKKTGRLLEGREHLEFPIGIEQP